jgi:adenine-specific DNA glycosylase
MVRREGGLLDGLWEPPTVPLEERRSPARRMLAVLATAGLAAKLRPTAALVRHTITHRRYEVAVWAAERVRRVARADSTTPARWVDPARPDVPITGLARKLATL